jgi:hypothetical protein
MPTTNHDEDDEIEKPYEISEIIYHEGRGQVLAITMRDFNRIVGEGSTDMVVGPFVLSKTNERGKILINFSRQCDMLVMNT